MAKDIINKINIILKEDNKTFSKEETQRALDRVKKRHSHLLEKLKDA